MKLPLTHFMLSATLLTGVAAPLTAAEVPTPIEVTASLPPLMAEAACFAASGPCSSAGREFAVSLGACLVTTVPFFRAIKLIRLIAKALDLGDGPGLRAAFGAFFCAATWFAYWDWDECRSMADGVAWQQAADAALAIELRKVADKLERDGPGALIVEPVRT